MHLPRRLSICLTMLLALAGALTASARAMDVVHLHADRVTFYSDRKLIEATGHVRVTTSDGLTITGETFSMDMNLNRFLIAGTVHLTAPTGTQDGAAVADYLDFKRVYFVPITTEPDRWTFVNGDYAHPLKGRQMPGDPFEFPDLSDARVYLTAKNAVIGAKTYVRFGGTVLNVFGANIAPLGVYYVNYSSNPALSQNTLTGATYDATWQFAGDANYITALHLRYDRLNHAYAALEAHVADSNAYAVLSVNPVTKLSKFWNFAAAYQPSDRFIIHDFSQLHTDQSGLSEPLEAQHVSNAYMSQILGAPGSRHEGSLSLSYQLVNYCLLQAGYVSTDPNEVCGAPDHRAILNNMQTWTLGVESAKYRLGRYIPAYALARAGVGLVHDTAPLQTSGGVAYHSIWSKYISGAITVPSIRLGGPDVQQTKEYSLNLSFNGQRTWYSVPHHIDTFGGIASISRTFTSDQSLNASLSYEVQQTNDIYKAGQQSAYPSYTPIIGGVPVLSYAAFHGKSTLRTLSLQVNYEPDPDVFRVSVLLQKHRDFPIPAPGLFPNSAIDPIGDPLYSNYLGQPPYYFNGDVFFRISKHFALDVSRSYYFNFGSQRWSPVFVIQVKR